jgi:hypothetical protein
MLDLKVFEDLFFLNKIYKLKYNNLFCVLYCIKKFFYVWS